MKERPFIQDVWDTVRRHPWECVVNLALLGMVLASCYAAIWIIGNAGVGLPR